MDQTDGIPHNKDPKTGSPTLGNSHVGLLHDVVRVRVLAGLEASAKPGGNRNPLGSPKKGFMV